MPIYTAATPISHDLIEYPIGAQLNLPAGSVRDRLLEVGAIFRADLPPFRPRFEPGGLLWVPAQVVGTPGLNHLAVPSINPAASHAWTMPGAEGPAPLVWYGFYLVPLDEWAVESWPWSGAWMVVGRPGAKVRLIP